MEREVGSKYPLDALDQLYTQILSDVLARAQLLRILTLVSVGLHARLAISQIEQLLELRVGDVRLTLQGLQSVIEFLWWSHPFGLPKYHGSRCTMLHSSGWISLETQND
jgi:hypothetical protein